MRISKSRPFWLIGVIVAVFAGLFLSICIGIVHDASLQELHPADAIVVFGAAEYAGRPSPVYRARLDHAYELFRRGIAPVVITSGGAAADPKFSEGGVGHDYLNMSSCIAVSDEYHVFRIRRLLEDERVRVYVAPRPESKPHSLWLRAWAVTREAVSYIAWRLHVRG